MKNKIKHEALNLNRPSDFSPHRDSKSLEPEFGAASKRPAIHIKTFGCQMNVRDSEIICGLLKDAGYKICDSDKDADIIIFNTCSVRKHAEDRVWSLIGSYKGGKVIGLTGCMAQNYRDK
ncbi:MAG: hypothetical protein PHX28_04430, partial [Candidatus Omnitrophica bacterium]|nr:hypothetical protein [Candidatus Omnitrophota bacterium]